MDPKEIVAPLQHWLLIQGRCVGCGRSLKTEKKQKKNGFVLITCQCRRIFVYQPEKNSYRRALIKEVSELNLDITQDVG